MFVKRTTDMNDILRVVPIEVKLREKEKTNVRTKDFLVFVQSQLQNPYFYFIIVFEDKSERDIVGYIALFVITTKIMDMQQVNVMRVYYDPKYRKTNIKKLGWDIVEAVAKEHGIKTVCAEVQRCEKAFMRTFGFKKRSTVLERRVG